MNFVAIYTAVIICGKAFTKKTKLEERHFYMIYQLKTAFLHNSLVN